MKSVKRVFKKRLPRYNLRSRKSAVPLTRNSTPKVNREVQAFLSEEENCSLLFELPLHPSSLPLTAHTTGSSEEIQAVQSNDPPFSIRSQANKTSTEAIDISIDPSEGPSIVQPSLSEQACPFVPREESDESLIDDCILVHFSPKQHGTRTDLEIEETRDSEDKGPQQRSSVQLIDSPADLDALVRSSINFTEPKQKETRSRFHSESSFGEETEKDSSEDSEDSEAHSEES